MIEEVAPRNQDVGDCGENLENIRSVLGIFKENFFSTFSPRAERGCYVREM
jgi:hypothetical protein